MRFELPDDKGEVEKAADAIWKRAEEYMKKIVFLPDSHPIHVELVETESEWSDVLEQFDTTAGAFFKRLQDIQTQCAQGLTLGELQALKQDSVVSHLEGHHGIYDMYITIPDLGEESMTPEKTVEDWENMLLDIHSRKERVPGSVKDEGELAQLIKDIEAKIKMMKALAKQSATLLMLDKKKGGNQN